MMNTPTTGMKAALLVIMMLFGYLVAATFVDLPATGNEHAKTIVPFLLGIISTLIGFYWGNSHKDGAPPISQVDETAKAAAAEIESKRIDAAKADAAIVEAARIEKAKQDAAKAIEDTKVQTKTEETGEKV
jgi:hypothetical protein